MAPAAHDRGRAACPLLDPVTHGPSARRGTHGAHRGWTPRARTVRLVAEVDGTVRRYMIPVGV